MNSQYNKLLILGAMLSAIASLLHMGCIVFGASWYRFLGAGEEMAQMAEAGNVQPTIITSVIAVILGVWSFYALSGAGVILKLPLLRIGLCIITAIYLIRGAAFFPFISYIPNESLLFGIISSSICLFYGVVHLIGLRQVWQKI